MSTSKEFYESKFNDFAAELNVVAGKVKRYAWYRLVVFLSLFLPVSIFGFQWSVLAVSIIILVFFFWLIKRNLVLEKQKKKLEALVQIVKDEQLALEHSFLHFQNGEQYLNVNHFFSYDLDLFGDGSLFQFLNRTSSIGGEQKLADWLILPSKNKKEIEKRQEAIRELSEKPEWRLQFLANGKLFEETELMNHEIKTWSDTKLELNYSERIKVLIWFVPLLTLLSAIPSVLGISNLFLGLMVFVQFLFMYFFWKRIDYFYRFFGRKSGLLEKYMQLLQIVEESDFRSEYLKEIKNKVSEPSASKVFKQLKSLVKEFEYRQNILVGLVLNGLVLWDIRCVYKLWCWHNKYSKQLAGWLNVISEIDALISLGNYANNHANFVFPEIVEDDFVFEAEELGHPLLKADKRICNDIDIVDWSKVMIVTGANMAGKSTFLRTVGVNLILARTGSPVCAKAMQITPVALYTNMRTTDSLLKDESYFFAELKRIKAVLDRLASGERIFVILDEMLKGTNSVDKLNGSKQLIRKLVKLEAVALIATHDLKLSELEKEYPRNVFNKCFEISMENDELVFDYKLSEGASKNMNATFLMKKMGII